MATGVGLGTQLTKGSDQRNANVTGISNLPPGVSEKRLRLLHKAVAGAGLAFLSDRRNPSSPLALRDTHAAAQSLGESGNVCWIETTIDIAAVLVLMRRECLPGLHVALANT